MSDQQFPGRFPSEVITEILTRLPAKSVCRFKCVSKTWKSLICDPHFVTSYIVHNSSSSSWIIVDRFVTESKEKVTQFNPAQNPNISSLSANHHRLIYEPVTSEWKPTKNPPVIVASSNGLLLVSFHIERDPFKEYEKNPNQFSHHKTEFVLVVINPVTGEWVPLPKLEGSINKLNSVGFMSRLDCSCNGVVEKFIVVEYQPIVGSDSGSLLCFSSDTGKWVDKPASYMLGMHFWRAEGVFEFAGRFFWVDLSCGVITWDDDDPFRGVEEEKEMARCRFIPLPKGCRKPFNTLKLEDERDIFGAGGYIHYMEMFRKGDFVLTLWRLKDFESGVNEWNLVFNLSRVDVESVLCCGVDKSLPRLCFIHPFDVDIVFFSTEDRIFSYNLQTQKVEADASFTGHKYVIPFVLPCWPTLLPPRLCKWLFQCFISSSLFVE
ncbi:putative F-box/kelch-repeat protein At4g22430 [Chenopodium quinoa]|uniref:F-box domain-containing protein n=1 Tax=Chenopodium quinoa TaxID=63459 RepID=A0A803LYG6_CHEQI|nr:putative F-box/kelch-repeat protein At4g22430 [Chenopodium quinoa]